MERIVESRKEYQTWTAYDLTTKSHRSNDCEPKRVFRCRNSTFRVDKKKCVELCFVFWISDVKKKRSRFFQGRLESRIESCEKKREILPLLELWRSLGKGGDCIYGLPLWKGGDCIYGLPLKGGFCDNGLPLKWISLRARGHRNTRKNETLFTEFLRTSFFSGHTVSMACLWKGDTVSMACLLKGDSVTMACLWNGLLLGAWGPRNEKNQTLFDVIFSDPIF